MRGMGMLEQGLIVECGYSPIGHTIAKDDEVLHESEEVGSRS
jgi:hypothetical protein